MEATGTDVLISAPQKGWSSPAGYGLVMLGERARSAIDGTTSTSFSCDLRKWLSIMDTYKRGGHAYHATMPTDSLARLSDAMTELEGFGFERAKAAQVELGERVRRLLVERGMPSVAAKGFEAPTVVVSYTDDPGIQSGSRFAEAGLQTAAGVPLQCDEPPGFSTFRIGLFGLDKLRNVERTVATLESALREISAEVR
jgi:aspartate aminotransferase-like enzyme